MSTEVSTEKSTLPELKFTPAPHLIVLELPEAGKEVKTRAGVYLPATREEVGVLVGRCVGAGSRCTVARERYLGKLCIVGRFSGQTYEIEGTTYLFVRPKFVLGVLEDEEA